MYDYLIQVLLC